MRLKCMQPLSVLLSIVFEGALAATIVLIVAYNRVTVKCQLHSVRVIARCCQVVVMALNLPLNASSGAKAWYER